MSAETDRPNRSWAAFDRVNAAEKAPVYMFGVQVTGLPALPASPDPPRAGSARAVVLRVVAEAAIGKRWESRAARRIIDRRLPDGQLVLAVDEGPGIGYRVEAPEVGVHLISVDGTEVFLPEPQGPDWFWQRLLFAQTLPIAATLQGLSLFHASAVRIGNHAVGVSARSGTGKSSIAAHLIAQGAGFFTDDVLAMDMDQGAVLAFAGPQFSNIEEHEVRVVERGRRWRLGQLLGASTKQHRRPARDSDEPAAWPAVPVGARRRAPTAVDIDALDRSGITTLLASAFIPHLTTDARLVGHLELCGQMASAGQIYRVRAPLHGSAAAVATVLMDHAQRRLKTSSG